MPTQHSWIMWNLSVLGLSFEMEKGHVRDEKGHVLCAVIERLTGGFTPHVAECLAAR
ncbi:hypothetical protein TIFTF001_024549 [Ficus carica]|uniref:Uncharacterized protein n=1 Tax=Ficus carica TaxID=3494 RepID=A0AA88DEW2_FICCA|nr:hypothetical protein TIFTF001_024549 [Ficus carica]